MMNSGLKDHIAKRKPDMAPYSDPDDDRLNWLEISITKYFRDWRAKAEQRPDFKDTMLLSKGTEEGIIATSVAMSHLVKGCLRKGASYALTRRCNQDCLESYFGHQRMIGRRNNNPTLVEFGYNANAIQSRRSVEGSNVIFTS